MACAPSTTPGLGDTAAPTATAAPAIFDSSFTCTAADFAPARRPHPRPWDRVPVPAVSAYITLRKVWKRVGPLPLSGDNARYLQVAAELRADGQGPRKMPRTLLHVPVWGDATWSEASTDDMPVPQPEADALATELTAPVQSSPLSHVPRKRNSQRQPVAHRRRAAPASPTADAPNEHVATPAWPEPQAKRAPTPTRPTRPETDVLSEETTEHITKRAKRRLSRRISMLPQLDSMSPAKVKQTAPTLAAALASPVKRRASFFILDSELPMAGASPTKAISPSAPFEPVLASSPVKTPAAQAPIKLDAVAEESDDAVPTTPPVAAEAQPHVVVFTQPTAEVEAESPQQVRRRLSLHNTRRRETWLAAADAISCSVAKPNSMPRSSRRHSLVPGQTLPSARKPLVFESTSNKANTASIKSSSRRHTFHPGTLGSFLSATSEGPRFSSENKPVPVITVSDASNGTTESLEDSTTQDETVVVDARTNLDIFGSGPPVQVHSSAVDRRVSLDREEQIKHDESIPTDTNDASRLTPESCKIKKIEAAKPAETAETEVAKAVPLSLLEEAAAERSNDITPRQRSPDPDTMTTEDSSPEITDEQSLVSRKRTSLALDESLLLPLPDTTETDTMDANVDIETDAVTTEHQTVKADDGWQSPTSAELELMKDLLDTPSQPEPPIDMSISPVMPEQLELDIKLPAKFSDDDTMEDADSDANADEVDDDSLGGSPEGDSVAELAPKVQFEGQAEQIDAPLSSDSASPSDDDENDDELGLEQVDYTVTQPIHMLQDTDEEGTMTMTMDLDALVEEQLSAHEDSETEMLRNFVTRVKADKSAKAKAKAAAAAAAAAAATTSADADSTTAAIRARHSHTLRPQRRSGSMGSTASASGSPMAKKENVFETISSSSLFASPSKSLDANRAPLGMKDSNMSPSPRKKRKELSSGVNFLHDEKRSLGDGDRGNRGDHVDLLSKPLFDDHSPPRQKRRRKKMEADTGSIFNPDFMSSSKDKDASRDGSNGSSKDKDNEQAGPRRSKRTRSSQTSTSTTAVTSANGVLSLIPVRLPGSLNLNGEDSYGLSVSSSTSLGLRRNDEKDLATMTRVNTRKNKAGSDPPGVVIQRLSQERAQEKWRAMVEKREQREQRERQGELGDATHKSVFDSPLAAVDRLDTAKAKAKAGADGADGADGDDTARRPRRASSKKHASSKGKTVRWAEVLARFQAQDSEHDKAKEAADADADADAAALAVEPADVDAAVPDADNAVEEPAPSAVPTPAAAAPEPERRSIPRRTTRVSRLPPPTPSKVIASAAAAKASLSSASTSETTPGLKAPRMATRRAKIVGLGMAANGTPAPKRRTTRTT